MIAQQFLMIEDILAKQTASFAKRMIAISLKRDILLEASRIDSFNESTGLIVFSDNSRVKRINTAIGSFYI